MGRKKKVEKTEAETPVINSSIEAKGIQPVKYQGTVSVKINHGNKTIFSRQYHNSGMPLLFKFLCSALSGEFFDTLRPCKIKLFYYPEADMGEQGVMPGEFHWDTAFERAESYRPKSLTPYITYDTTPVVKRIPDADSPSGMPTYHYETTYHFRVTFELISDTTIHMIGIYPNNAYAGSEQDVSAYYLFVDEETQSKWEPLELGEIAGNFSIVIDWTMALMNKSTAEVNA